MKKILFINLFLILLLLPSFAGNISLFEEVKLPFFIYFNRTKYHPIAYFEYNDENNYSVGFDVGLVIQLLLLEFINVRMFYMLNSLKSGMDQKKYRKMIEERFLNIVYRYHDNRLLMEMI